MVTVNKSLHGAVSRERSRLLCAQAAMKEMEVAKLRGELIPAAVIRVAIERVFSAFKSRIEAIPRKAVPQIRECETDASREKAIRVLCHEALDELSRFDFDKFLPDDSKHAEEGGGDPEATAGPDGESVVGRVPDPVPRGKRRTRKVVDRKG